MKTMVAIIGVADESGVGPYQLLALARCALSHLQRSSVSHFLAAVVAACASRAGVLAIRRANQGAARVTEAMGGERAATQME